jgi:hypothetical protein
MKVFIKQDQAQILVYQGGILMQNDAAKIVIGALSAFDLYLTNENGTPKSAAAYTTRKLAFVNCDGERTEINIASGGADGKLPVSISASDTEDADKNWKNADLILDTEIYPLTDYFTIVEQNAPEV